MTNPANPHGYIGDFVLYATRCGHPIDPPRGDSCELYSLDTADPRPLTDAAAVVAWRRQPWRASRE